MAAQLQELLHRAQQGDYTVLPELREILDDDPLIWRSYGDLAAQAQSAWLDLLAGKNLVLRESVERKLEELRAELAGSHPSPLEKLLVERVAACWLQTMYADALYAQAKGPGATPAVLRELLKRQESSQRRYLAAIKQLALVRKLLKPSLSPVDLAMSSIQEEKPAGMRKATSTPTLRLAGVMN